MQDREFVIEWTPVITTFSYTDKDEGVIPDPNISDEKVIEMCIEHFNLNYKDSKHSLLGFHYAEEEHPIDIWANEFNHLCHSIEEIWKEGEKYMAKIKLFDYVNLPEDKQPKRYIGLICHSEFTTRLLKINSLS